MSTSNISARGELSVERIAVPKSPAAGGSADFSAFQQLAEAHELELWGNLDRCATFAEAVLFWQGNSYEERQVFLARLDGTVVGSGTLTLPLSENTTTAGVDVVVSAPYRRRGFGSLILKELEGIAKGLGRVSFDAYCGAPIQLVAPGTEVLESKSGAGCVPLNAAPTRFALHHGYSLEQVETSSLLPFPAPEALLRKCEAEVAPKALGYSLVTWRGSCPEDLVDTFARLKGLMSTEVPIAGLGWEGEEWDAARVRQDEVTWQASGGDSLTAAARHDATGELAAYTVLTYRDARPAVIYQEDTLVAPGHRGHGLGMMVKIANLRSAKDSWPDATSVLTWNANENRHMLAINIALGFKPSGFEGEWQKRLG
ncbi:GNAT family N-acetyltransferase [Paenarthrobacter sp. CAP02]|uniref:GNAT family N-acetyltransferase n=1 Tax=Paenarthrobacter sp. CAP02 TaxID=3158144 RepID=UPI0032DA9F64